ncbi:MAG: hypothetical protein JWQ18_3399 [Conexibacter sp.]|nr:hypothetical protein [Conexibacter sp.]
MIAERFHDFFVASAGVAGALIGLLFVAISVAPERLLSADASQSHRVRASTSLTAFSNALTISLFALVPDIGLGWPAVSVSLVGLAFVLGALWSLLRVRREQPEALRDASFLLGTSIVLLCQLDFGIRLTGNEHGSSAVSGLCVLVIVCFLIGVARAWELIGGPSIGLGTQLADEVRRHREEPPA